MKYIFDLDETLIQSTTLNNDEYNFREIRIQKHNNKREINKK